MHKPSTPTLLTKAELKEWLKVSDFWVRDRLEKDPEFVHRCVIDLAPTGSSKRTLRYHLGNTADYLGIPAESVPAAA
ncbi:hypothetical protein [Streptomyces sp. SID2119]|uniref:hypothetical protein n=1 Tax=Streptomyces TaxID=1883 RepID=UPI00136BD4BB|nr:hypothetical protein [Streptomyces sp. SID2119]MYW30142.1 hypothetical protein [Streptomyces sp. SID2119]